MAEIGIKFKIDTNEVCVKCVPPHIKGVCRCSEPTLIPIEDWLHLDNGGNRDWPIRYRDLIGNV
jgi:hypothetical protein